MNNTISWFLIIGCVIGLVASVILGWEDLSRREIDDEYDDEDQNV